MPTYFRFPVLLVFALLFACSGQEPPADTTPATTVAQPDKATMPQDQTRGTRNANPETVAPERLEEKVAAENKRVPKGKPETEEDASPAPSTSTAPPRQASGTTAAADSRQSDGTGETQQGPPSHSAWQALLKTYVNANGDVDYDGLRTHEKALDAYLADLAVATPKKTWSTNQAFAYWLNAYNAYTVKLILDNYPVKSIRDIDGGDPWKTKWIQLEGKMYSLNEIEHDIIRPRFKDPRIHFAVVCAANSCPPLANEAFTSTNVNQLLEARTRRFINNERYNQAAGDAPKVSKIFEWYAEDFGDVRAYLNKFLKTPLAADAELGYLEYDWALNKQ